jgi:lysophospholipase L1-like esterase
LSNRVPVRQQRLLPCTGSSTSFTIVIAVVLLITTTLLYNFEVWQYPISGLQGKSAVQGEDYDEGNRCYERTDPEEWKKLPNKRNCACPDPSIATNELRKNQPDWMKHHQTMVNDVIYEASQVATTIPLDIVFLGDSITERWNGTRSMGANQNFPQFRQSFDSMFNKRLQSTATSSTDAKLQGLLFGSSGDITTELLWHIQNGVLNPKNHPYRIEPKVFMILIGTNDLGRMECSKHTTIAGIMSVLNYISVLYPTTPLIVHGLLPRSDVYNQGDYYLGRYWQDIVYINTELERICSTKRRSQLWHYLDANHIFLTTNDTTAGGPIMIINETIMSDSLHPDVIGYDIWGQEIVQKVLQIISEANK